MTKSGRPGRPEGDASRGRAPSQSGLRYAPEGIHIEVFATRPLPTPVQMDHIHYTSSG